MRPPPGRKISRRQALGLLGLGAATVATGAAGWATVGSSGSTPWGLSPVGGAPLQAPREHRSRGGRLAVELVAAAGAPLAGHPARAWGYNGSSPGPTLRVRPGDELAVRLRNELDQPTNLHTHGLRVSPQANSDNPFVHIAPGQSFDYRITIPAGHLAGTFWYHPHSHGHVADQLFAGLAGALVVDDPAAPAVTADRVLLITDTTLDSEAVPATADAAARMTGRQGELLLLNGQYQPVIPAVTGDLQRWRLINATTSRTLTLSLDTHPLTRIALDGVTLPSPTTDDAVRLAPGARADLLIRPDRPGSSTLTATTDNRAAMGMTTTTGGDTTTLATVDTTGPARPPSALPTLPATAGPTPGPISRRRQLTFTMGMAGGMGSGGMGSAGPGMRFGFDGRSFDPARTDQAVTLGAIEEWTITNPTPVAHPFHLHVWPFEVLADSAGTPTTGTLQDVVLVPAGGWVRLRIPFTANPGRSVYHCHILDHEDAGMMAIISVS